MSEKELKDNLEKGYRQSLSINRFAKNLEDILRIKNITQKELAEKIDVRPSTINQWVNAKREPTFDNLLRICYILEVEPNELLGYTFAKSFFDNEKEIIKRIAETPTQHTTIIDEIGNAAFDILNKITK